MVPGLISFAVMLTVMMALPSCDKKGINGDLDGMWQVMEVTGPDGEPVIAPKRVYYAFQFHVCQLRDQNGRFENATGNLVYEGDMITLDFPYEDKIKNPKELEYYGIFTNPVVFHVEKLDKKSLIMVSKDSRVVLRRF